VKARQICTLALQNKKNMLRLDAFHKNPSCRQPHPHTHT